MYMRVAIIHYCREGSEYLHFYDDHVAAVQACLAHYNWANGADRGVLAECLTSVCESSYVQHPRTWVGATRTNTEMKPLKALLRKHFTIVIRKCVIGGNAEHPSRNRMKHLAPRMASFLI